MIKPTKNHVFIRAEEKKEQSKAGIILPESATERPLIGVIAYAGPDCRETKVGDRVLFKKYGPDEMELEGEKLLVGDETDIIAIINE